MPTIVAVTVMIPIVVVTASIVSVALTVTIIAPLVPSVCIVPITIAVTKGDVSEVDGHCATASIAVVAAVSPIPIRHAT